jgi:hypothetical protein
MHGEKGRVSQAAEKVPLPVILRLRLRSASLPSTTLRDSERRRAVSSAEGSAAKNLRACRIKQIRRSFLRFTQDRLRLLCMNSTRKSFELCTQFRGASIASPLVLCVRARLQSCHRAWSSIGL